MIALIIAAAAIYIYLSILEDGKMREIKTDTIIRTIVLAIALINQILAILGREKLPITDDMVYQVVTIIITIGASLWAWWKNNSFTIAAIEGGKVKDHLKQQMRRK